MKLEDLKESKWKKKKKERLKIRMSYRTSKCCNGATELTAPRYTVIVQWLTYRLRIAPGLQVPFGGITDSQHPPADASAEIDGKTEKKKEEEKEEEEERRKEDWWYYLGQKTAKGPLIETGRQF
ncbi:hypothetical protein V1477_015917 [Vespula maculifrons]|uniref:Uncharacterized protein n=1 Tax=Vespula maculifrons TaxID=7453 RepID=A0ABD2BBJ0_VESMC